ncbi:ABC transporter permease [Parabacteroides sp.]
MSNNKQHSPFQRVLRRELQRMVSRRLYFGVCIVLPLFCIFFMSTIFGNGQMENIPVGIVDKDQTALSRELIRQVEAVPTFRVTRHYVDEEKARQATQAKEIYGYLVIPNQFEQDVTGGTSTTLSYYYHYALLSVGGEVRGAFENLLRTFSMTPIVAQAIAQGISQKEISTFLVPIKAQNHPLFNPDLDYSVYLSNPFFFIFFQVIILLTTVYAVGSELKFHTSDDWLATAGMNMVTALFGKLLPYTVIFSLMSILGNYVMFGLMNIPFSCGFLPLNLTAILFVIASQALAVFLFSLFPAISIIISIVSMVGSLGATLSGVTFPAASMYAPVYFTSFLFPVRHFVEINQNLLYGDYGFAYTWWNFSALGCFILVAFLMVPHLKRAILSHKYDNIK